MTASCGFLEEELRQFCKDVGVTLADSMETLEVDLTGSKSDSEEEKVQCEVLSQEEESSISKELHESGYQEVVTCRCDASKDLGSPCSGDDSNGEVNIEETHGGGSRQGEYDLIDLVHGDIRP